MFPILLEAHSQEKRDEFVANFIKKEHILPYAIFTIQPLKDEIVISQIREIKKELIIGLPYKRLFVIYQFDTATLEAQNAFLKTLEEKNEKNQFILCVAKADRVLPTIRSRSKVVTLEKEVVSETKTHAEEVLTKIKDSSSYAFLQEVSSITRQDAQQFLNDAIIYFHTQLPHGKTADLNSLKKVLQVKQLLDYNNLNPQLALDTVLIFYKKQLTR